MITNEDFSSQAPVEALSLKIKELATGMAPIRIMHLCGSHEHALNQYSLRQLLPETLSIIPGPGCPVCVCPAGSIDEAIHLSKMNKVTVLTFGDMLRVPGTKESLAQAKSNGASVQMVYSPFDALDIAKEKPEEQFVFFAIGFETTMAGVAGLIKQKLPENLYFLVAGRYMPPVLKLLMEIHDDSIQGFLLPGHACIITGLKPYRFMEKEFSLPCTVAGFEASDVLYGIYLTLLEIKAGTASLKNAYTRAVKAEGNVHAQEMMAQVFNLKSGVWRGIDQVEDSAFTLKKEYAAHDATKHFDCNTGFEAQGHPPGCQCHRIMLGELTPVDCKHFKGNCTIENPIGPCMVSPEGTCNSWLRFGVTEV
ncbi:MAG: hydrogenase formation protein HypD [SAR324 cluster bacterium]|nr:hydrogenase formation protein HypD [SAR324 cluster bacterium]